MRFRRFGWAFMASAIVQSAYAYTKTALLSREEVDQCDRSDYFETKVVIDHDLLNKKWTTTEELSQLAELFRDTYNTMNAAHPDSEVCDRVYNRAAYKVAVKPLQMVYNQYEGQTGYVRQFLYFVGGTCTGCASNSSLFDEGTGRTSSELNKLEVSPTSCDCPESKDPSTSRGPTEAEFKKSFKSIVKKAGGDGTTQLQNTASLERVVEVEGDTCNDVVDQFSTVVSYELSTTPSEKDLEAVQVAFVNGFNFLLPVYCDPMVHIVESATAVSTVKRSLRRKLGDRLFDNTVRGRCRGCGSDSGLFDDGRRLQEDDNKRRTAATKCLCSRNAYAYTPPTIQEFAESFNRTLMAARKDGYLSEDIYCMSVND